MSTCENSFILTLTDTDADLVETEGSTNRKALCDFLHLYDKQQEQTADVRTPVLHWLPKYKREEDQQFFKVWNIKESPKPDISGTSVGILTVNKNSTSSVHFCPLSTAVVVEDELVVGDIPKWVFF
uniref:Uncharacterized protein n=1 Tax=Oryzias latipes TaxID=8090 RepID=Q589P2_ORYLA|nr:hypothetical protein [Oryzias latipes]